MTTTKTTEPDWIEAIGKPHFETIAEMVAAAGVDYDRLEDLREERRDIEGGALKWDETSEDGKELAKLEGAAGDCKTAEDARERIEEDPLSIEVGGWWLIGDGSPEATEYRILLSTGGPAARIIGELDQHNEATSARLEVQDWGKLWTEYPCDGSVLLQYVQCLYLGD